MSIRAKEDSLFNEFFGNDPRVIKDGLVQEEAYETAKYRIVYVLKEVNGGESWDLRDFVRDDGGRPQTWDNIARWTQGIMNLEEDIPWSVLGSNNEERRKTVLKQIAAVNLKKTSGGHTADNKLIYETALENDALLREQMSLYEPDIIICCGTSDAFVDSCYKDVEITWEMTSRGIWYFRDGKTVVISYVHPEARGTDSLIVYGLIDAIKEILGGNNNE